MCSARAPHTRTRCHSVWRWRCPSFVHTSCVATQSRASARPPCVWISSGSRPRLPIRTTLLTIVSSSSTARAPVAFGQPGCRARVVWALSVTGDNGAAAGHQVHRPAAGPSESRTSLEPPLTQSRRGDRESDPYRAQRHRTLFGRATVPGPYLDSARKELRDRCGPGHLGAPVTKLLAGGVQDRKSTRLNSSHDQISYAVF